MTTTLKPSYGASSALTTTGLQSLASDSNLIAGWASAVIDNTSNLSDSEEITVVIETGTTPTVSTNVFIYLWEAMDDTPTYPDTITGSEGTKSLTSANVRDSGAFKLAAVMTVDATTNRKYYASINVPQFFGGHMPKKYGIFIVHNTVAAFPGSGCVVTRVPLQYTNG